MRQFEVRSVAQLGAVVRRLRHDRSWTQRELAEIAQVSRVFVSQLENGKARSELRLVLAVLQALDATVMVAQGASVDATDLLGDQPW